ncbi:hypothetical protein Tco_0154819 [Tanacetum coccineum]
MAIEEDDESDNEQEEEDNKSSHYAFMFHPGPPTKIAEMVQSVGSWKPPRHNNVNLKMLWRCKTRFLKLDRLKGVFGSGIWSIRRIDRLGYGVSGVSWSRDVYELSATPTPKWELLDYVSWTSSITTRVTKTNPLQALSFGRIDGRNKKILSDVLVHSLCQAVVLSKDVHELFGADMEETMKRGHVYKFLRSQGFVSSHDTAHHYTDTDAHKMIGSWSVKQDNRLKLSRILGSIKAGIVNILARQPISASNKDAVDVDVEQEFLFLDLKHHPQPVAAADASSNPTARPVELVPTSAAGRQRSAPLTASDAGSETWIK